MKKAERLNLISERRFELLVSAISDYAIYMLDVDGTVASWNAGAQRFKGYIADEIIGDNFSRFYTEEDRQAGVPGKALRTALEEGKFEAEGWRVRKDGTKFWTSVLIDPIFDTDGHHIGFAKVMRDISDRKIAQDALRESEQRFRMLVQGVTDYAIYMLSPTGEVTNWNAGAERIKGYTAAEVVGTHFSRFHSPEDQAAGLPGLALKLAAEEGRFEREAWRVRKDGTRFWAHVVIDAIYNDDGTLAGFAKITRDITEKKKAADDLEQANAALYQSQKMEAIGQLTGGIAHDFNNLLSVISCGLEVLPLKTQDPMYLRIVESMRRAVDRGATLTQQLLSFARQQPLNPEKHNPNALIRGFESVLRRAATSIDFEFDLAPEVNTTLIDGPRFETALLNLIVNARDAMPGGGTLTVRTANASIADKEVDHLAAGTYVKVTVSDTGCGMSPEVAARAFEPFFTTKDIGKGTGLGLSQVFGFVTQSGGGITIKSGVEAGTKIECYFPVVDGVDSASPEQGAGSEKALVVDDEPDMLDVAAELFRSIGYEVYKANNGIDALEILHRSTDISVLFSDVMMPDGMSGIELARQARELRPNLKIVLSSGYPLPALKAQHASLDDFKLLNKPYRLADLSKMLRLA